MKKLILTLCTMYCLDYTYASQYRVPAYKQAKTLFNNLVKGGEVRVPQDKRLAKAFLYEILERYRTDGEKYSTGPAHARITEMVQSLYDTRIDFGTSYKNRKKEQIDIDPIMQQYFNLANAEFDADDIVNKIEEGASPNIKEISKEQARELFDTIADAVATHLFDNDMEGTRRFYPYIETLIDSKLLDANEKMGGVVIGGKELSTPAEFLREINSHMKVSIDKASNNDIREFADALTKINNLEEVSMKGLNSAQQNELFSEIAAEIASLYQNGRHIEVPRFFPYIQQLILAGLNVTNKMTKPIKIDETTLRTPNDVMGKIGYIGAQKLFNSIKEDINKGIEGKQTLPTDLFNLCKQYSYQERLGAIQKIIELAETSESKKSKEHLRYANWLYFLVSSCACENSDFFSWQCKAHKDQKSILEWCLQNFTPSPVQENEFEELITNYAPEKLTNKQKAFASRQVLRYLLSLKMTLKEAEYFVTSNKTDSRIEENAIKDFEKQKEITDMEQFLYKKLGETDDFIQMLALTSGMTMYVYNGSNPVHFDGGFDARHNALLDYNELKTYYDKYKTLVKGLKDFEKMDACEVARKNVVWGRPYSQWHNNGYIPPIRAVANLEKVILYYMFLNFFQRSPNLTSKVAAIDMVYDLFPEMFVKEIIYRDRGFRTKFYDELLAMGAAKAKKGN